MACAAVAIKRHRHFDFEPLERSHKRRRVTPSTLSSAVPPTKRHQVESSPFSNLNTLSWDQEELTSRIRYHIKRYNRQRQSSLSASTSTQQPQQTSAINNDDNNTLSKQLKLFHPAPQHPMQHLQQSSSSRQPQTNLEIPQNQSEGPMFTIRQVSILCERAMKEKEEQLKLEYEQMLSCRLIEQYECFLKFNNDTMFRRPGEEAASYVS